MVKVLVDISYSTCYYATGSFLFANPEITLCSDLRWVLVPIISALPLWWRFNQVMRQYYDTRQRWPYLGNAFKYALAHSVVILGAFHPLYQHHTSKEWDVGRILWLWSLIAATLYSFYWDCKMDWGLFEWNAPHRLLRKQLHFSSPIYYYVAIVINLILRFSWTITLTPFDWSSHYETTLVPILALLELYRRFQWGILRVEYEHLSTTGGYRQLRVVPMFFDSNKQTATRKSETHRGEVWLEIAIMIILLLVIAFFFAFL